MTVPTGVGCGIGPVMNDTCMPNTAMQQTSTMHTQDSLLAPSSRRPRSILFCCDLLFPVSLLTLMTVLHTCQLR
jgi:hypothetical protein